MSSFNSEVTNLFILVARREREQLGNFCVRAHVHANRAVLTCMALVLFAQALAAATAATTRVHEQMGHATRTALVALFAQAHRCCR